MTLSDADLLAYLDEALPEGRAVEVERAVRESGEVRQRLSALLRQRDQGGHTLGEIWRRRQLSCVSRTDLSRYLSGNCHSATATTWSFIPESFNARYVWPTWKTCARSPMRSRLRRMPAANESSNRRRAGCVNRRSELSASPTFSARKARLTRISGSQQHKTSYRPPHPSADQAPPVTRVRPRSSSPVHTDRSTELTGPIPEPY